MPTYLCFAAAGRLTPEDKARIAKTITRAHSEEAHAPSYFAEVIFQEFGPDQYFLGGQPGPSTQLWIRGDIRAGRTEQQRSSLLLRLAREVGALVGGSAEDVWVYLNELQADNMVEYGALLPRPGGEEAWFLALPETLRQRLTQLGQAVKD